MDGIIICVQSMYLLQNVMVVVGYKIIIIIIIIKCGTGAIRLHT